MDLKTTSPVKLAIAVASHIRTIATSGEKPLSLITEDRIGDTVTVQYRNLPVFDYTIGELNLNDIKVHLEKQGKESEIISYTKIAAAYTAAALYEVIGTRDRDIVIKHLNTMIEMNAGTAEVLPFTSIQLADFIESIDPNNEAQVIMTPYGEYSTTKAILANSDIRI